MKNIVVLALVLFSTVAAAFAQTTEFIYQGRLIQGSLPANGNYDFEFTLYDGETGGTSLGTISQLNVAVTNGTFSVRLDFGSNFPGGDRFIEIKVKQSVDPTYTTLNPRQKITSAPYSYRSNNAGLAGLADLANNAIRLNGIEAYNFVLTNDGRLSDARMPLAGSDNYIQNSTNPQAGVNFSIGGTGTADTFNAMTQFSIGGNRVLTNVGNENLFAGANTSTNGAFNSFFGAMAGNANTTGNGNSFFGRRAGFMNTTASNNSFFGNSAGASTTTGGINSFFGIGAGSANTTGSGNTFFGSVAGITNTIGSNNTIIGSQADLVSNNLNFATAIGAGSRVSTSNTIVLGRNDGSDSVQIPGLLTAGTVNSETAISIAGTTVFRTFGLRNTFVGKDAGLDNEITASDNSFFGNAAGLSTTTGKENSFFGSAAGFTNTTGFINSFFGVESGKFNTTGSANSFFGRSSGGSNTSGNNNSFFGTLAGFSNTTGGSNTFIGYSSGLGNTTGSNNTAIGYNAGFLSSNLSYATAIGAGATVITSNTIALGRIDGSDLVRIPGSLIVTDAVIRDLTITGTLNANLPTGSTNYIQNTTTQQAGSNFNISGNGTVGGTLTGTFVSGNIVAAATQFNINGSRVFAVEGFQNTFVGLNTGNNGRNSSFFGTDAGTSNQLGGDENSFFGSNSGNANTTGGGNSFFGAFSGRFNNGSRNSFFGRDSGKNNTIGSFNVFLGEQAGLNNTTGDRNTFVGEGAGQSNTTGSNNTALGEGASVGAGLNYATAIGSRSAVFSSNTIALGRSDGSDLVRVYGNILVEGLIEFEDLGLGGVTPLCRNFELQISTCSSSIRYKSNVNDFRSGLSLIKRLRPVSFNWRAGNIADMGLVAEEVAEVEPLLVTRNKDGEVEGVKYDRVGVVLVNAVQEQQEQIESQQKQIDEQKEIIKKQEERLEKQQRELDALKALVCSNNPTAEICKVKEEQK